MTITVKPTSKTPRALCAQQMIAIIIITFPPSLPHLDVPYIHIYGLNELM